MVKICPLPQAWAMAHSALRKYSDENFCVPATAPKPLILGGWSFSNDVDKMKRWQETVDWAISNGCSGIVLNIPDDLFYFSATPTTYEVGPTGGPMYLSWNYDALICPSKDQIKVSMAKLRADWLTVVGTNLVDNLEPVRFTGKKFRRLVVDVAHGTVAPWGDWTALPFVDERRRKFTVLRKAINKSISPHMVDHVDFNVKLT